MNYNRIEESEMIRALVRTGLSLGTIFAAGYIARRYFGWNTDALMDKANSVKDKISEDFSSKDLKTPLKDVAGRHAI